MSFPPGIKTTLVTGRYLTATGDPVDGYLEFTPTAMVKHPTSNTTFSAGSFVVQLLGDGTFQVELPVCQSTLVPSTFLYQVTERFNNYIIRQWNIRLDEAMGPNVSLVALSPAVPPTLSTIYPTLSDVASVAAGLDQNIYQRLDELGAEVQLATSTAFSALDNNDLGIVVPNLVDGKIPIQFIPPVPQGNYYPVTSQTAMLQLPAVRGDFALRSDVGKTYVLSQDDPTVLASWLDLPSGGSVASVNGKTGAVVLSYLDLNAAQATHTHSTLPSLTSLNVTSATINTASVTTLGAGGVSTLRAVMDSAGVRMLDSAGTQWFRFEHGTKTLFGTGAAARWMPGGETTGGLTQQAVTHFLVTGTVYGTQIVHTFGSAGTTNIAMTETLITDYDKTAAKYQDVSWTMETASMAIGAGTNKALQSLTPEHWAVQTTDSTTTTQGSITFTTANYASGELILQADRITADRSSVHLGDDASATQRIFSNHLLGQDGNTYERRSYLYQSAGASGIAEVLFRGGAEVARFQLTPDGDFQVKGIGSLRPVVIDTDSGVINLPLAAGWATTSGTNTDGRATIQVINGIATIDILLYRTGAALVPATTGNLADTRITNAMTSVYAPKLTTVYINGGYDGSGGPSHGMCYVQAAGVTLAYGTPGSTVDVGDRIYFNVTYQVVR